MHELKPARLPPKMAWDDWDEADRKARAKRDSTVVRAQQMEERARMRYEKWFFDYHMLRRPDYPRKKGGG
jgi:hypothetical protein